MFERVTESSVYRYGLSWLKRTHLGVLLALLVAVVGVWGFIELADNVMENDTHEIDSWVVRSMRQPDDVTQLRGPPWLIHVVMDVTALGGAAVLTLVVAVVCGYLALRGNYAELALVLAATVGALVLNLLFKGLFERVRPELPPLVGPRLASASFPSGHAMLSAAVYLTLGALLIQIVDRRAIKAYLLVVAVLLTLLVGTSRVVLGVHYPTDVLAGWSLGLVWAVVCGVIAHYLRRLGAIQQIGESQDVQSPDQP